MEKKNSEKEIHLSFFKKIPFVYWMTIIRVAQLSGYLCLTFKFLNQKDIKLESLCFLIILYIYIYIYIYISDRHYFQYLLLVHIFIYIYMHWPFGQMGKVFAWPGRLGFNPRSSQTRDSEIWNMCIYFNPPHKQGVAHDHFIYIYIYICIYEYIFSCYLHIYIYI